jgi:predicted adenylyl cyclase CyaB
MNVRRRNIEVKAQCDDLAVVRAKAEGLGARDMGTLHQRDTFFAAHHARLKLREFGNGRAELISYVRPDVVAARGSDYVLAPVERPGEVRAALEHALGILCTVTKVRHLFLLGATRIHLDEVEGLGSFVELETVIDQQSEDEARSELGTVANALDIRPAQLIGAPYAVLLEHRLPPFTSP